MRRGKDRVAIYYYDRVLRYGKYVKVYDVEYKVRQPGGDLADRNEECYSRQQMENVLGQLGCDFEGLTWHT